MPTTSCPHHARPRASKNNNNRIPVDNALTCMRLGTLPIHARHGLPSSCHPHVVYPSMPHLVPQHSFPNLAPFPTTQRHGSSAWRTRIENVFGYWIFGFFYYMLGRGESLGSSRVQGVICLFVIQNRRFGPRLIRYAAWRRCRHG